MKTICVSRKGGIDICLLSVACSFTLTTLIKVHWLILVWFERKTKSRQHWHKKTGARCRPGTSEEGRQRWSKEGIIWFHFWCIYFNQMMKTSSRDGRLICDDDSELITTAAKIAKAEWASSKAGMNTWYIDWVLAAELKRRLIGRRWTLRTCRDPTAVRLLCESCILLQPHANWF